MSETGQMTPRQQFGVVKGIDWVQMERRFVSKLRHLAIVSESLEDNPTSHLIAKDLIIPAVGLLMDFDQRIEVKEEDEPEGG